MRSIWGGQTSAIIHEILNTAELIIMDPLGVLITAFKFKYIPSLQVTPWEDQHYSPFQTPVQSAVGTICPCSINRSL